MPLYEYRCVACLYQFEELRPMGDEAKCCPQCGGRIERVYGGLFTFRFRGRNWKPYTVDGAAGAESVKEEICVG